MAAAFDSNFSFNQQLWYYYTTNRGKIRSRYNDLTRKFLAYNDSEENPHAFLRKPQFEALEMYVFVKEFMNNKQVYEMFDDWRNRRDRFSDASYYAVDKGGQIRLFDAPTEKQTDTIFKQMKKYREDYPNYIYALTMGLGKTILMATCIFYEFLLAKKYPRDKRFCHNALVFAPDKTVLQSLREIMTFDKTKVVPPEYARVLDANIKFHFLDESGTILHTIDDSDFNIIISNTQKIIVKKKRKETTAAETLFSGSGSLLSAVYGTDSTDAEDDAWDDSTLMDNQRFKKLCRLPQLGVYVDEAHHLFGADLEKQIRSSGANKTSLRDTINLLAANTSIVACYNYTGTPYVKNQLLPEVVYAYGLRESIWNGFLKDADPIGYENVKSEEFLTTVVTTFWERYGGRIYDGLNPKLAIYAAGVEEAVTEVKPALERILAKLGVPASKILLNVGDAKYTKNDDIRDFNNLDVPGTEGNEKQFIILVEKGKEGWNCRSLFGVALFRSPKSKIFVLQATMRCLRAITDERLTATVFLSKENFDTLDDELHKNFNMEIFHVADNGVFAFDLAIPGLDSTVNVIVRKWAQQFMELGIGFVCHFPVQPLAKLRHIREQADQLYIVRVENGAAHSRITLDHSVFIITMTAGVPVSDVLGNSFQHDGLIFFMQLPESRLCRLCLLVGSLRLRLFLGKRKSRGCLHILCFIYSLDLFRFGEEQV